MREQAGADGIGQNEVVRSTGSSVPARAPRPPIVYELPPPRPVRDGIRVTWWLVRGFAHASARRKSPTRERAVAAALTLMTVALVGVLAAVQVLVFAVDKCSRHYMSAERDAVLSIRASRRVWSVAGHAAARPGTGSGAGLRRIILPELLVAADDARVELHAVAASNGLRDQYAAEVPGLVSRGPAWPRGWHMHRPM